MTIKLVLERERDREREDSWSGKVSAHSEKKRRRSYPSGVSGRGGGGGMSLKTESLRSLKDERGIRRLKTISLSDVLDKNVSHEQGTIQLACIHHVCFALLSSPVLIPPGPEELTLYESTACNHSENPSSLTTLNLESEDLMALMFYV